MFILNNEDKVIETTYNGGDIFIQPGMNEFPDSIGYFIQDVCINKWNKDIQIFNTQEEVKQLLEKKEAELEIRKEIVKETKEVKQTPKTESKKNK